MRAGWGRTIELQHGRNTTTLYGHMSRFAKGIARGQKVQQGEVIGYVGMSGLATGPHLHYEFRIADHARDPLAVGMPTAPGITTERLPVFQAAITPLTESLALAHSLPGAALAAAE